MAPFAVAMVLLAIRIWQDAEPTLPVPVGEELSVVAV
jgi:hypothetical protein